MKILILISLLMRVTSCKSQMITEKIFTCGQKIIKINIPSIKKTDIYSFEEGKSEILILEDKVIIEFYCASNYGSHISDKNRYKVLSNKNNIKKGIDLKTNLYWRKDGKLIYSNCKSKDTVFYNKIFDVKIIIRE
ncbi:MAG: hypothetical protein L3J23_03660 [Flavobacteriaceae bacterium]|nr:hypothetical protein [Flavobacteriaceae bacterium]